MLQTAFTRGGLSWHHQARTMVIVRGQFPQSWRRIGFTAQPKPDRFENTAASARHTLPLDFNPGDATGTQGI